VACITFENVKEVSKREECDERRKQEKHKERNDAVFPLKDRQE
jgi:hypothetical protein